MVAILLAGLVLRVVPMGQNRTLEDEALYSYWGLQIATGSDPMLDHEPVDKPPFWPYVVALSFRLFGGVCPQASGNPPPRSLRFAPGQAPPLLRCAQGQVRQGGGMAGGPLTCATSSCLAETRRLEAAARLPSLFASVVSIALVYALGRRLYRDATVGLLAALLSALSPFAILFASTAFVDPWLTAWVLGALLAASARRTGLAGILAGLAAATKQQGLLFVPLVVAFGVLSDRLPSVPRSLRVRGWVRWLPFLLGFAAVLGGSIVWDQARTQRPGFFQQSVVSYGGLGFAAPSDLGGRALSWLRLMGTFWGSSWLNGLLLGILAVWAWVARSGDRPQRGKENRHGSATVLKPLSHTARQASRAASVALLLFVLAFLILHWLLDLQIWDRYLLVLLPCVSLLLARAVVAVGRALPARHWRPTYALCLATALMVTLPGPLLRAVGSQIPVGGDHGAYDGIDTLSSYVRTNLPPGSVLYDHWLGYHYRFYLYGAALHIHWYPDLADLIEDAQLYVREPRYIAFPSWRSSTATIAALTGAGVSLAPIFETYRRDGSVSFQLYQLVGP